MNPSPSPTLMPSDLVIQLSGSDLTIDAGTLAIIQKAAAILAIVVVSLIVMRLAHVFVRGTAAALLSREKREGSAQELTAVELKKRQDTIEALAINVVRLFVSIIAGLMILETGFGLDIGPAIAGLGIAGIAVGLGTQHLVRDYLNGALILIENQYGRGDVVRVAGVTGTVEDFTLRRTTLRDADGTLHTVPNGEITVASNLTRVFARVNQDVQVVYGTDIEAATASINRVGEELAADPDWGPRILEAPRVDQVSALGDLGLTIRVTAKVRAGEQWDVGGELRKRLLSALGENGVELAQAQRVVAAAAAGTAAPAAGRTRRP
ncbi:MAG: mechanosensitive ion channel family protein [Candidatus Limnocylindrales bacterium]